MIKSLFSGVTGLKSHNQKMDVIGNNIANVNTTAYKANNTTFKDVFYQTKKNASSGSAISGGVNSQQVGYGVKMGTIGQIMTQSGLTYSDSVYDCALQGEGFFQVMDPAGNIYYTRNGVFGIDDYGNFTDANGYVVLGVSGDPTGIGPSQQRIAINIPNVENSVASVTKTINGYEMTFYASGYGEDGNISLLIQNSDVPYATYNNGTLSVSMDLSVDFPDADAFETAFNEAIRLGGVNVPNVTPLRVEFGSIPSTNVGGAYAQGTATINGVEDYDFTFTSGRRTGTDYQVDIDSAAAVLNVTATWGTGADENRLIIQIPSGSTPTLAEIQAAINAAAGTDSAKRLTVEITGSVTGQIGQNDMIDLNNQAGTATVTGGQDVTVVPNVDAIRASNTLTLSNADYQMFLTFTADVAGASGNKYEVNMKSSTTATKVTATWTDSVLTITVPDDAVTNPYSILDIQDAILNAAGSDPNKVINVTLDAIIDRSTGTNIAIMPGLTDPLDAYINRSLSPTPVRLGLTGGKDNFFREMVNNIGLVKLEGGHLFKEQAVDSLDSIFIDNAGVIYGEHAVHGRLVLGRIDLATFENPAGLNRVGTSYWQPSLSSGDPEVKQAGTEGAADIVSGALEMSNVDLSQEFSDMIITQRGFQANSRIITVSDTMLEELVNLKR